MLLAANWVLGLHDLNDKIEEVTGLKFSTPCRYITYFQKRVMETFITDLKNSIVSQFSH